MAFLEEYKAALLNPNQLQIFVNKRLDELYDYYSLSNYDVIVADKLFFKNLPIYGSISQLDFKLLKNEAYLNLLLSSAVRLNEPFSYNYFLNIFEEKGLKKTKIIEASTIFMNCRNATELIAGYEPLLNLLEVAFLTESDNRKEPLVVLLNYYATAVFNYAEFNANRLIEIRELIVSSYQNQTKTFIQDSILPEALNLSIAFEDNPYTKLQVLIDNFLERNIIIPFVPGFIVESGTNYATAIEANYYSMNEIWDLNRYLYNQLTNRDSIFYSLGRGTAILTTEDQLIVYMSQLGKMHFAKLNDAFNALPSVLKNIHLFDWGCGQAPASKMFIDKFLASNIKSVTLIEPSQAALKRASLHLSKDTSVIRTINKDFDSLVIEDINLKKNEKDVTVHIFSNVIDMEYFQLHNLIDLIKANSKGLIYFVLVSPLISTTQTQRLETFVEEMCNNVKSSLLLSDDKRKYEWIKTWTKVIRVFKIEL